jgi:hypothetical protein
MVSSWTVSWTVPTVPDGSTVDHFELRSRFNDVGVGPDPAYDYRRLPKGSTLCYEIRYRRSPLSSGKMATEIQLGNDRWYKYYYRMEKTGEIGFEGIIYIPNWND